MVRYNLIAYAGLAVALPLNINLGAYSPALVVGDGEISFGGRQDVSSLINALEGAAVNAAAGAAGGGRESAAAAAAPVVQAAPAAAAPTSVVVESAASADPTLTQQAQQIAAIQGLGKAKEIAPREKEEAAPKQKRDLAGFDRALQYAEVALTKGPKVELGTGAEGSGIGIIVDNNASAGRTEAGAGAREKRDVDETTAPRRRARVTTMYVRRGVPASLQGTTSEQVVAREITPEQQPRAVPLVPVSSTPSRRDAIDAVNLNVDGDAGLTMTFVETVDDDEEE